MAMLQKKATTKSTHLDKDDDIELELDDDTKEIYKQFKSNLKMK
jgi:hypothetical protein